MNPTRFKDAKICQDGASNVGRVAGALVNAIKECHDSNIDPAQDPAVFLILHQLTWLLLSENLTSHDRWDKSMQAIGAFDKEPKP